MTKPIKIDCPSCKKSIEWSEAYPQRPFCCERCQLIDLGEWASENHKIKGQSLYDGVSSEELEN